MANHPSALKRQRQSEKKRLRYKAQKRTIADLTKEFEASTGSKTDLFKKLQSKIAKLSQKGNIHKNTAARKISKLSKAVSAK